MRVAKGRDLHLYVRSTDEHLWAWAERQAAARRLALSQFIAMLIEQHREQVEGNRD